MRFKKLKKVISKTDSISVLLTNDGGDEAQTFLTKKDIPKKFNNMEVVGIGWNLQNVDMDCMMRLGGQTANLVQIGTHGMEAMVV